jgi:hypothetical protein
MVEGNEKKSTSGQMPARRTYHPPRLKIYGVLKDLTTAGSGRSGENIASQNRKKRP